MLGTLGHRVRTAALSFAAWAPSAGVLLLLASLISIALTNSPLGPVFQAFWHTELAVAFGDDLDGSDPLPLVAGHEPVIV